MAFSPSLAFLTGSVGAGEWVVLFVVVLIVVGPKRLPDIARKIGRTMEMFRRAADEFKDQIMTMDQEPPASSHTASPPPAGGDGAGGSSDSYGDAYPNMADYPGNEGYVENWAPDAPAEAEASGAGPASGEAATAAAAEPEGGEPPKTAEGGS